jgi:hypothetical protein
LTYSEGLLTDAYDAVVSRYHDPQVQYESFPINKWCRKYNFRNMTLLVHKSLSLIFKVEKCSERLINNGIFLAKGVVPRIGAKSSELRVQQLQTGSLRVSCLDSLDRTNLTCSIFAKHVFPFQVDAMMSSLPTYDLPISDSIESRLKSSITPSIVKDLTNVWADSGDSIAILYVFILSFIS